jgi:hypothetical protein
LIGGIGAISAVGAVGAAAAARDALAAPAALSPAVRRLSGVDWRMVGPVGGTRLPTGSLADATGAIVGRLETSDLATSGAGTHLHRIHLADGTLTGVGPSTLADAEFTVVGGTGRYAHATGTYRIQQSPRGHNWGDGTATLDLTLSPSEASR